MKADFAAFDNKNRATTNEKQAHLKAFNMDYSTVSTPTFLFILCLHPCQRHKSLWSIQSKREQVLHRVSNSPVARRERWQKMMTIRLSEH